MYTPSQSVANANASARSEAVRTSGAASATSATRHPGDVHLDLAHLDASVVPRRVADPLHDRLGDDRDVHAVRDDDVEHHVGTAGRLVRAFDLDPLVRLRHAQNATDPLA